MHTTHRTKRVKTLHTTTLSKINSPAKACILPVIIKLSKGHFWNACVLFGKDTVNIYSTSDLMKTLLERFPEIFQMQASTHICIQNLRNIVEYINTQPSFYQCTSCW